MSTAIQRSLFDFPVSTARLSPCGQYRYMLTRQWAEGPFVTWCMLNPSTADAAEDDPTIRRCVGFATRWGYAGIRVVNLFALRATDPSKLKRHPSPVGPDNVKMLRGITGPLVAAWGDSGPKTPEAERMAALITSSRCCWCLGKTKSGQPRHPVRLAYAIERQPFGLGIS